MSKVVGVKVSEALYTELSSHGKLSDVLREAIQLYLRAHTSHAKSSVNRPETAVNRKMCEGVG